MLFRCENQCPSPAFVFLFFCWPCARVSCTGSAFDLFGSFVLPVSFCVDAASQHSRMNLSRVSETALSISLNSCITYGQNGASMSEQIVAHYVAPSANRLAIHNSGRRSYLCKQTIIGLFVLDAECLRAIVALECPSSVARLPSSKPKRDARINEKWPLPDDVYCTTFVAAVYIRALLYSLLNIGSQMGTTSIKTLATDYLRLAFVRLFFFFQ